MKEWHEVERTGWPPGLLQDDSRGLCEWFASKPDARRLARQRAEEIKMDKQEFTGLDDLRRWLESHGFRCDVDHLRDKRNLCDWYAWRREKDGRPQIEAHPFDFTGFYGEMVVTGVSLKAYYSGEGKHGPYTVEAYSLTPEDLMAHLPEIQERLYAAVEALSS